MSDQKNKRKAPEDSENLQNKKRPNDESDSDPSENDDDLDLELGEEQDFDEDDSSDSDLDEDDDDEEEDEEGSDEEFINQEIQIEFSAYNPDETDYHGIKCLLQRLWLKESVDLNELSDLLIDENTIASVLKQENEEESTENATTDKKDQDEDDEDKDDVYGIVSLIPFNELFSAKTCIQQIKSLLLSRIPKDNLIHQKLQDSKSVCALVINERFLNLPPKISLPCYQQLLSDLKEFKPSSGEGTGYDFDSVIMVCKVLKPKQSKDGEIIYTNAEDEVFDESAEASFEYSVADQCDSDVFDWDDDEHLFEPFRKILLLSKEKWTSTVDTLKEVV